MAGAPLLAEGVALGRGLGVIPTVMGHSALNYAMRHLRGQAVAVANLGQFVFAGTIAWGLFGERPTAEIYAAAALVVGGAWLAVRSAPPGIREEARQAASETPAGK